MNETTIEALAKFARAFLRWARAQGYADEFGGGDYGADEIGPAVLVGLATDAVESGWVEDFSAAGFPGLEETSRRVLGLA